MSKFKDGDKVVFTSEQMHRILPDYYPKPGTVGTVIDGQLVLIQWPKGSTSSNDRWYAGGRIAPYRAIQKIVITADGATTTARLYDGNTFIRSATAKCSPSDTYDFATGANLAYDRLMRPDKLAAKAEPEDKPEYKAGDKVRVIKNTCAHPHSLGDVVTLRDNNVAVWAPDIWHTEEKAGYVCECDFEPYTESVEDKPEPGHWSGKVVCIQDGWLDFTKGKVYNIVNGKITDDDGDVRGLLWTAADTYGKTFIEYKGGADS